MHVTVILGGTPLKPGDTFQIDSMHAGTNQDGKTWSDFNEELYKKHVTKHFFHFLQTCPEVELVPIKRKQRKESQDDERRNEAVHVTTKEGGPDCNLQHLKRPDKQPEPVKALSQQKKISERMRARLIIYEDSSSEGKAEEKDSDETIRKSLLPLDSSGCSQQTA
uniref:Uncharacterized protein n=1 Tax=Moniliophthora roreri TaxID=221103 RepID=A0A0W0GB63_MONRR